MIILVESDSPLNFCKEQGINDDIITDINIKMLTYIKKGKKQKYSRNVQLTRRYLKDNDLVAVPFDKGTDICVMKVHVYQEKLMNILKSSQFQKLVPKRKKRETSGSKRGRESNCVVKTFKRSGQNQSEIA